MGSFWDQGPSQDFNLGGFQPAPVGAPNDPRLSTQPQPYQQGPVEIPHAPSNGGIYNPTTNPGGLELPPGPYGDTVIQGPGGYQMPPWLGQGPATGVGDPNAPKPPFTPWSENTGMPPGWTPPAPSGPLPDWMQKKPGLPTAGGWLGGGQGPMSTMGDFYGNAARAVQSPMFPQAVQRGLGKTQQQGQQLGSAIAQPANPSQQSGQVGMMSPTGQFQYVNAEHVPHYQNMGATIHNGSSYGSQSGGF
jgi:hypothetical protein